jgi:hypothetical protein
VKEDSKRGVFVPKWKKSKAEIIALKEAKK